MYIVSRNETSIVHNLLHPDSTFNKCMSPNSCVLMIKYSCLIIRTYKAVNHDQPERNHLAQP